MSLVQDIDAHLPQTQCGQCGYAGCRPYAEAMAANAAPIHLCPPGGVTTLRNLGELLRIDPSPYEAQMLKQTSVLPMTAVIRETECIGCTKCIQACPVDAIVGAAKFMHTILDQECTGCGLCIEPCPVDCIDLVDIPETRYDPNVARARHAAKHVRLLAEEDAKSQHYRAQRRLIAEKEDNSADKAAKNAYILAALGRVKVKP